MEQRLLDNRMFSSCDDESSAHIVVIFCVWYFEIAYVYFFIFINIKSLFVQKNAPALASTSPKYYRTRAGI